MVCTLIVLVADLSSNMIGDQGAEMIAAMLEKNGVLSTLLLGDNKITGIERECRRRLHAVL